MIPSQLKTQLNQVAWITLSWTLVSLLDFLHRYGTIEYLGVSLAQTHFNVTELLIQSITTGISAGFLGGSILIFAWNRWLRMVSYGRVLLRVFLSFSCLFFFISIPTSIVFQAKMQQLPMLSASVIEKALQYQWNIGTLSTFVFWLLIGLGTLIVLQVNDKYGPGMFQDFLLGRYFHPKKEERIFMFLDLRSSTRIAEQLGESNYFNFLKEVFVAVTPPILQHKGEIYQYVGDEIVISWKTKHESAYTQCINCFFEIQEKLIRKKDYFRDKYRISPEFKAGLHTGSVMVGEIGVVKREIAYSGDVLNTTSRIQSLCNELKADLLVSKPFLDKAKNRTDYFQFREVGEITLRGKAKPIYLFEVLR